MNIYIINNKTQEGPYTIDEVKKRITSGVLTGEDLCWYEGITDWVRLKTVPAVFPSSPPPPPQQSTGQNENCSNKDFSSKSSINDLTPNRDLMTGARESLKNRWGTAACVSLVYFIIVIFPGLINYALNSKAAFSWPTIILWVYHLIIDGPLILGFFIFFLRVSRQVDVNTAMMFEGFNVFLKSIITNALIGIFVFLWSLLLIIPGILAIYSYSMTFYILADHPSVPPLDAIRRSKELMRGKRWKLAKLQARFIGWYLLAFLTCGIGLLWITPYSQTAISNFYNDIKSRVNLPT